MTLGLAIEQGGSRTIQYDFNALQTRGRDLSVHVSDTTKQATIMRLTALYAVITVAVDRLGVLAEGLPVVINVPRVASDDAASLDPSPVSFSYATNSTNLSIWIFGKLN